MTNEEKAIEINGKLKFNAAYQYKTVVDVLVEMAEWKDEQIIDFLYKLSVQSNPAVIYNMITAKITEMKGE